MSFQIQNASKEDVESIIEIYFSNLDQPREEASLAVKYFFDRGHVKVVKHKGKIIGVTFWKVWEEKHRGLTEIMYIWVNEDFRRRGLGEKLLRSVIEDMNRFYTKGHHILREIRVTTGEDNEPAKKLYEKVGFQESLVHRGKSGEGENDLVYILTLNP